MYNLPYKLSPQNWKEYMGHERTVQRVQQWIVNAPHGMPRSIFISGPSGTGKTALTTLLIKSTHCMNRSAEDPNPCGQCDSCKNVDARLQDRRFDNVHWVQPGGFSEETVQSSVKAALSAGAQGPVLSGNPQRDILFLVFDEWQKIDSRSRQQVLIRSEVETDVSVCYIFITMQPEQLSATERIASVSRSQAINLLPFSEEQIERFMTIRLEGQLDKVDPAAIKLIARHSSNSLRMAISLFGSAKELDEHVTEDVAAEVIQAAPTRYRQKLWRLIESPNHNALEVQRMAEKLLTVCAADKLVQDLQRDLLLCDEANSSARYEAFNLLRSQSYQLVNLPLAIAMLKSLQLRGIAEQLTGGEADEHRLESYYR